jgi:hypothetical protein
VKDEIKQYVKALESGYMERIEDLKRKTEKEKRSRIIRESSKIKDISLRSELEHIFVDCIEDVRKDIIKRRLKNEILNKK